MRAVRDATGIVIAPLDTTFDTYTATLADGSQVQALAPMTALDPTWVHEEAAAAEVAALAAPAWKFVSNNCFSVVDSPWAVLDHCYYKYKLASDRIQLVRPVRAPSVRDGEPQLAVGARSRSDPRVSERRFVAEMGQLDTAEQLVRWWLLDDEYRHLHACRRHLPVV